MKVLARRQWRGTLSRRLMRNADQPLAEPSSILLRLASKEGIEQEFNSLSAHGSAAGSVV
jgi:hypothetical protein